MGKANKMEEINNEALNFNIDEDNLEMPLKEQPTKSTIKNSQKMTTINPTQTVNCLRNERIVVRYIPKLNGIWGNNPKHILAGGMSENAVRYFVVPKLSSGMYVNVLTDSEKAF